MFARGYAEGYHDAVLIAVVLDIWLLKLDIECGELDDHVFKIGYLTGFEVCCIDLEGLRYCADLEGVVVLHGLGGLEVLRGLGEA